MKKHSLVNFLTVLFLVLCLPLSSCSDSYPDYGWDLTEPGGNGDGEGDKDGDEDGDGDEDDRDDGEIFASFYAKTLDGYPAGVKVNSFTHQLSDTEVAEGYYAVIDFTKNSALKLNATNHHNGFKTVPAIFSEFTGGTPVLAVNAGYFWSDTNGQYGLSLVVDKGDILIHRDSWVWSYDPAVNTIRATFGRMGDGRLVSTWTYGDDGKVYSFDSPLTNDERTETFINNYFNPADYGGVAWTPYTAISAGPMLLQNGEDISEDSYYRGVFSKGGINGLYREPRTCIGGTADDRLIILVCEGRSSVESVGYTLSEMAGVMKNLGAVHAINLDGGGSTTMVGIHGESLNYPSEKGVLRPVGSAFVITQ